MSISIWFKTFAVMSTIADWSTKALADGKVTPREGVTLIIKLAEVLGLPVVGDVQRITKTLEGAISDASTTDDGEGTDG